MTSMPSNAEKRCAARIQATVKTSRPMRIIAAIADLDRSEATVKDDLPAVWSCSDAGMTRLSFELLAANSNELVPADAGDDDASALAQQLREQVFQLLA